MKQWTVLLILLVVQRIKLTYGYLCKLTANASLDMSRQDKLALQLQCGSIMCPQTRSFRCNNIHDKLAIDCPTRNCMKVKTYTLCEIPQNICIASTELQNRECTPVTITAYKTISRSLEHTTITKTPATIPKPSPSAHHDLFNRSIVAPVTTKTIVSVSIAPCSHIAPMDVIEQLNESVANQYQATQVLGALLCLVVVALVVVITGWVWTCWIMKKRQGIKITSDKQERSFQNPMYTDVTVTKQSSTGDKHHMTEVPTYATVSKPSKRTCGSKNNQVNNTTTVDSTSQMHNYHQEPEDTENNYSLLGREESGEYNITERSAMTNDDYEDPDKEGEEWGQAEENDYHVLEGPTIAEGEGPMQDEATVYEVPVSSKTTNNN